MLNEKSPKLELQATFTPKAERNNVMRTHRKVTHQSADFPNSPELFGGRKVQTWADGNATKGLQALNSLNFMQI